MGYSFLKQFFLGKQSWASKLLLAVVLGLGFVGCGYTFQNSKNPLYLKEGVQKIYLQPMVNNSYKPGIENVLYNNLVRTLSIHQRVTLVSSKDDADAVLSGTIDWAGYGTSANSSVAGLRPIPLGVGLPTAGFPVATEYMASLSCNFVLTRTKSKKGKKSVVWASSFSRAKPFPAANQLGVPGTTSALINDSEFDRAISDLSRSMMDDVHESMVGMF